MQRKGEDLDIGVERGEGLTGRVGLGAPDVGGAVEDLPLEVRDLDRVRVDDPQPPHTGGRQVKGGRRAEPPGADDEDADRLSFGPAGQPASPQTLRLRIASGHAVADLRGPQWCRLIEAAERASSA